jgi:hypothetical protein
MRMMIVERCLKLIAKTIVIITIVFNHRNRPQPHLYQRHPYYHQHEKERK